MATPRVAICPHISVEHFRGGEKWAVALANRMAEEVEVSIHALPYAPGGTRKVKVRDVLEPDVPYSESWRHDLSKYDSAYIFYNPFSNIFFHGANRSVAGIHSWVYISDRLFESHYGIVPTIVKALYWGFGQFDLNRFDVVHTVTPAFESPHPKTIHIPNFVDTEKFNPDRTRLNREFTVLVTSAHITAKGWDTVIELSTQLPANINLAATGTSDSSSVRDLGFLNESALADAYSRSHVVLHPARVDTDSMVINEALASGTPVITTPIPTHIRQNRAVIHSSTITEMRNAIRRLYSEWKSERGYEERCEIAREEGLKHDFDVIYPRLKRLLVEPEMSP